MWAEGKAEIKETSEKHPNSILLDDHYYLLAIVKTDQVLFLITK